MKTKIILTFLIIISFISMVSAWTFNGTIRDVDGNAINNTLINITFWTMGQTGPSLAGSNSTTSNASGWFNLNVFENSSYMYQPIIRHTNATTSAIDYIGQSLPQFPYREFVNTSGINFYLRPAGTINITAINSTGNRITFRYQIKDTKLGYPIAGEFNNAVSEAIVYVPRDRNYSIMIYPDQAMPVSFDWTNFTSASSYNITAGLSKYNVTTRTVQKTFNSTQNLIRLTGYINSTVNPTGWNEFTIVPYLLEPGNMIYLGDNAGMPYNMSAWNRNCGFTSIINQTSAYINSTGYLLTPAGNFNYNITAIWANDSGVYNISVPLNNATFSAPGVVKNATATTYSNVSLSYTYTVACSDSYNLTSGFYNITLPGPAESATYILFATARNGSNYYGGYRNVTLTYSSSSTNLNFTMYPLMSTNWGSLNGNISLTNPTGQGNVNISSAKKQFNLINSSGNIISNLNAHLEVTVDYSNYGAREFTFMTDLSSGSASFYLPLLNASVKEMNIFSQSYSPKGIGTKTPAQILNNSNITMTTFNPRDIDGADIMASVQVALYKSNSTCNVPNPSASCVIADSASMDPNAANSFNPLSSVVGGGKLNFRMGLLSSGIIVEYINVDMLASGPPDALFDDSATTSTSGNFASAMRFGSNGPKIYDYVLVSIPYTEGSSSTTGLNENADVNMSIPALYDENWNVMWSASANGTSGNALAGNYSYYSARSSEWQTLMGQNNCTTDVSGLNSTNPCYIDTSNNKIWIRLPHFSGTQPSITGSVITATAAAATTTTSPSGGGSVAAITEVKKINFFDKITPGVSSIMKDFTSDMGIKEIQIMVNNEAQNVQITVTKYDTKPAEVSVEKTGNVYKYLQINATNLENKLDKATLKIQVNKSWVSGNSLTKDDVALFRLANNQWTELTTTYKEEDSTYYYYEASSPGFSYFAIGQKETTTTQQPSTTGITETGASTIWIGIVIGILVLGIILSVIFLKKKKRRK